MRNNFKTKMQFSSTLSILALASIASAAKTFGLLVIRSGSSFQYLSVGASNGVLVLNSDGVTFQLNEDNSLVNTASKKFVSLADGAYVESDTADKSFGLGNGYLTHGSDAFYACPSGGVINLASSCSESSGSPIALSARDIVDIAGTHPATTTPASNSSSSSTQHPVDPVTSKPSSTQIPVDPVTSKPSSTQHPVDPVTSKPSSTQHPVDPVTSKPSTQHPVDPVTSNPSTTEAPSSSVPASVSSAASSSSVVSDAGAAKLASGSGALVALLAWLM